MPPVVRGPRRNDLLATTIACVVIGGGLILAMFLSGVLHGCAVGYGTPGPDGNAPVVWGLDLGEAANSTNKFFTSLFDGIGGWIGVGGLGTGGVLVGGLVRAWAKQRTNAAAATAAQQAADAAWDAAHADASVRTAARDAAFDEGVSRAGTVKPS